MTRYQPSQDEFNDEALKSHRRAEEEQHYYDEHPQEFLDRVAEVGRLMAEAHRDFTKNNPF